VYLGAHLGIAGGLDEAVREAKRIGCESLQIFAKSPQMWKGPPISEESANRFREAVEETGLKATAVHHGYLLNLGQPDPARLRQSQTAFLDELGRAERLGVRALIFHPGAHLGSGSSSAVERIAKSLNQAFAETPGYGVRALVENAAGQGTTIGSTFEELAGILERVDDARRVGICLDTCHLFAAGFDFRTPEGYRDMIDRLDRTVGLSAVHAFHLNDAKAPLGSHLDRHENIGQGEIGIEGFRSLVNDERWVNVPGYLETPLDDRDYSRYVEDLLTLRGLIGAAPGLSFGSSRKKKPRERASTVK
jgi:deoxyribonuclease-4